MAFTQTRFFGLSIVNFTSSMGWGDSPSTITVTLVNDPSNGDSLISPVQGQPATFAFGSFTFGGIVKSFARSDDFSASPLYTLLMEDPRELLSGVSLILSGYNGTISVPNVMNIYGYLENLGGFGYSKASSIGIHWEKVRDSLVALTTGSAPDYGGAIKLGTYQFRINLDSLPELPSFYRITSPNISVLDFVREVCDAANHDYFFTLEIINNINYIVLKTINRNSEPAVGSIAAFILSTPGAASKNVGYEFRNEITSKFLIGGQVSRMYGIYDQDNDDNDPNTNPEDNTIWHFWGVKSETDVIDNLSIGSDVIMGLGTGNEHTFTVDSRLLKSELIRNNKIGMFDTYTMDIGELRAARYSQEAWEAYLWMNNYNRFRLPKNDAFDDGFEPIGQIEIAFERRTDKFNDVGDHTGFDTEVVNFYGPQNDRRITRYLANYRNNQTEYYTDLFPLLNGVYGIPNPHWGKAERLGLIGGVMVSEVALFLGSRTDEEFANLRASSFASMHRLDHELGADSTQQEENIARIYNFVKKYADEYYGKKWMIKVPSISAYRDTETNEIRYSHTPEDTGFIDESEWEQAIRNNLLPFDVNRLSDTDGKFYAYVKFPKYVEIPTDGTRLTPTHTVNGVSYRRVYYLFNDISEDDKIDSEVHNSIFIKCEIDPNVYFEDVSTQFGPRVVITLPGIVKIKQKDTNDVGVLSEFLKYETNKRYGNSVPKETADGIVNGIINTFGSDMYRLGKEGLAHRPHFAAVPLKSNVLVYGPWYATGANGRTEFEQDDTLVPWNYGGFDAMNNAANAKVTSAISLYNISEAGSVEFPDIPGLSLGDPLTDGGSYVTEVTVSIDGSSGARTTYNLATWTPHPYRMRKFLSDYISRLSKNGQQLRRNLREQARQPKQNSRLAQFKSKTIDGLRRKPRSTHFLIGGEVKTDANGFTNSMVGLQPVYNASMQMYGSGYNTRALMSLDGLFLPFSTNPNANSIAHFERPSDSGSLNINDYNPYRSGTTQGILTHGQDFPETLSTEHGDIDYLDVRAIALKTPLILGGWGWDTDGKPIPNSGVIATSGSPTDDFHQDYLRRQDLWKVGPLDTKWDDDRKVWSVGSSQKLVQVLDKIPSNIPYPSSLINKDNNIIFFSGDHVYPISNTYLSYTNFNYVEDNEIKRGYMGGAVYFVRYIDLYHSGVIGSRVELRPSTKFDVAAHFRPSLVEPSSIWVAQSINNILILDNQTTLLDFNISTAVVV